MHGELASAGSVCTTRTSGHRRRDFISLAVGIPDVLSLTMLISLVIAYQLCLTFWTAAFPSLSRNTVELREKAQEFSEGSITREEYDYADSIQRSRISNVAFYVQSVAELFILAVIVGIMFGINVTASTENNNWGFSVLIAFASGVWVLVAIPWFVIEKRRPGQNVPAGMNM